MSFLKKLKLLTVIVISLLVICPYHGAFAVALRIGYYGGTFDPVTLGHRQLIERSIESAHALFEDVGFIIGQRAGTNQQLAEDITRFNFGTRELIVLPLDMDQGISSSQVRKMLQQNIPRENIPLNSDVYTFIKKNNLYAPKCSELFLKAS